MDKVRFVVEHAGCASCASPRDALAPIATVHEIEVDEAADVAAVRVVSSTELTDEAIREALRRASARAGHEYRIQPGSWVAWDA